MVIRKIGPTRNTIWSAESISPEAAKAVAATATEARRLGPARLYVRLVGLTVEPF